MNRHGSMNRIYRLIWSQVRSAWVPVAETARGRRKSGRAKSASRRAVISGALSLALTSLAHAAPTGGQIVAGSGSITQSGNTTDIHQSSQDLSIDWQSFNISPQQWVDFLQPSASAIAVNRIVGTNGSEILGHLDASGQVYLINPNGIIFGQGAQVNVGGLVASTLAFNDPSLSGNTRSFIGSGTGSIVNDGVINAATGGYVALLGNHVSNQGVISAQLGTVALGSGSAITLSFAGNSLVHLLVDQSVLRSLAENGGLIQADGGRVLMTAGAKDALLASVVNNTGVIEARTVENHEGTISLLGGMTAGTVKVGGTLDASAPEGGDGGFIETDAAHVEVANDSKVTTAAPKGLYGSWLIDPATDFTVAATGGDISGATLSSDLNSTNFTILSSSGTSPVTGGGSGGNINVNDTISWSANTSLTLTAANSVNVNSNITASGATAALAIKPNTANGTATASGTGTFNVGAGVFITLSGASAGLSIATSSYTLGAGATINLPNVSPASTTALIIGGTSYTVINSLGDAGSTTGTDLQGINGKLSGHYAAWVTPSAT
jgi:filamentous hemagglutinin family protein